MDLSRIVSALALIAAICVLTIFFFPAMQGPYPAVHGPVTALLAARAAAGLRMAIAVRVLRDRMSRARIALTRSISTAVSFSEFRVDSLSGMSGAVLRC
jgi:hypothetical protein